MDGRGRDDQGEIDEEETIHSANGCASRKREGDNYGRTDNELLPQAGDAKSHKPGVKREKGNQNIEQSSSDPRPAARLHQLRHPAPKRRGGLTCGRAKSYRVKQ
jgi:hypothetical protein